MPFTPTYQNVKPVVGGSADTWGGVNNDRIDEAYNDFTTAAGVINATETLALGAMPTSGGTFAGPVNLHNSGPSSPQAAGWRGCPVRMIPGSAALILNDAGGMVRYGGTTGATVTIPNSGTVGFPRGTAVVLRNFCPIGMPVVRAAGVELRAPLSTVNKDFVVPPQGMVTLLLEDANMWIIQGPVSG